MKLFYYTHFFSSRQKPYIYIYIYIYNVITFLLNNYVIAKIDLFKAKCFKDTITNK